MNNYQEALIALRKGSKPPERSGDYEPVGEDSGDGC